MYNFIFFVIYSQQIRKKTSESFARYNGCIVVSLAIGIHVLFILALVKYIFKNYYQTVFSIGNKNIHILLIILLFVATILYYNNRRTEKILKIFENNKNPLSSINILKTVSIIFAPLIFIMLLSKR